MYFGGHQSLWLFMDNSLSIIHGLLNCLRSKNTLKRGWFWKFSKVTAKPKVMENLKRSVLSALTFGSADNTYLNLDYSRYHKNLIQYLFIIVHQR